MNAQIGNKFSFHRLTNRNGQYLLDFSTENELICLNTKFQKKESKLWTHTYPTGTRAQLTLFLYTKIRLSLRANKSKVTYAPPLDWSSLTNNEELPR